MFLHELQILYYVVGSFFTTRSVPRLFGVDDGIINKSKAVSGIRFGMGNLSTQREPATLPTNSI
jgi:hypothetical protein